MGIVGHDVNRAAAAAVGLGGVAHHLGAVDGEVAFQLPAALCYLVGGGAVAVAVAGCQGIAARTRIHAVGGADGGACGVSPAVGIGGRGQTGGGGERLDARFLAGTHARAAVHLEGHGHILVFDVERLGRTGAHGGGRHADGPLRIDGPVNQQRIAFRRVAANRPRVGGLHGRVGAGGQLQAVAQGVRLHAHLHRLADGDGEAVDCVAALHEAHVIGGGGLRGHAHALAVGAGGQAGVGRRAAPGVLAVIGHIVHGEGGRGVGADAAGVARGPVVGLAVQGEDAALEGDASELDGGGVAD